jgi:serine/threonine-protein kinase
LSIVTGTRLGQYEIQDFIGQGAMGLVYRAYHVQLERTAAVKVLQAIAPDPDTTARFRHEAQAIAQMRHPNIVNVYDFGEYQGTPYMIVEYVPGGSLADRLTQGRLHDAKALKYLRGIAAGLDYAHELGIVHRDVKPANVLLEKDDTPVLADFGLVKLLRGTSLKSMTGVTTGTPAYMAPEQVTGSNVGPPADRYSLASIAYEILTGVIPFHGDGIIELLYAQVHREPLPPSARDASLGAQVDAVIMRGLSKDPAARWESCTAFVDALTEALATAPENGVAKTMVLTPGTAPTMRLDTPLAARGAAAQPLPKRRSRRGLIALAAAAVLVALLIVAGAGYLAMNQRPSVSLSPSTVAAGGSVLVTATRIPANQDGEIQLHSTIHTFPFHTGANGNLAATITVPRTIGAGNHAVKICWAATCYASATLLVYEPVASVTSSPGATPTGTSTPTPNPTTAPTRTPTPSAAPTAAPTSTATPVPTPTPTPTPAPTPTITLVSVSALGNTTVTFHDFTAGAATVYVWQNGSAHPAAGIVVTVAPGSNSTVTFKTPVGILPALGAAYVRACAGSSCMQSNSVAVGA